MKAKKSGQSLFNWRKAIILIPFALVVIFTNVYFVREMLVAELFFVAAFIFFLVLVGLCYLLGLIGECGWKWIEGEAQTAISHSNRLHALWRASPLHPRVASRPVPH
jgi:hypothetical protein